MKKISILSMIAFVAIILSSCGGGKVLKEPLAIKPINQNIVADFDDDCKPENNDDAVANYMEIVDSEYSIILTDDGNKLRIDVKVKSLKKADKSDEFRLSDYYTCGQTYLYLIDDVGTRLMKSGTYLGSWDLVNFEAFKGFLTNNDDTFTLRFEIYADYMAEHLKTPEKIKGFLITCSGYKESKSEKDVQSTSVVTSSSDIKDDEEVVTKKSGNTNWDKVLTDYEAYTDKYIKLLKKANSGDASAMTEYMEMLTKAQEFQESLADADDDLTPAQLQKFTKIQMKLANAAAGL